MQHVFEASQGLELRNSRTLAARLFDYHRPCMPIHLSKPVQDRIRSETGFHLAGHPLMGKETYSPHLNMGWLIFNNKPIIDQIDLGLFQYLNPIHVLIHTLSKIHIPFCPPNLRNVHIPCTQKYTCSPNLAETLAHACALALRQAKNEPSNPRNEFTVCISISISFACGALSKEQPTTTLQESPAIQKPGNNSPGR